MRNHFLRNDDLKEILREIFIINVASAILNIWSPRLGGRNAFGRKIYPMSIAEICQTFCKPTAAATEIHDLRPLESQSANQTQNLFSAAFGPRIENLPVFPILPMPVPKISLVVD